MGCLPFSVEPAVLLSVDDARACACVKEWERSEQGSLPRRMLSKGKDKLCPPTHQNYIQSQARDDLLARGDGALSLAAELARRACIDEVGQLIA
jgi:hypothetical protein